MHLLGRDNACSALITFLKDLLGVQILLCAPIATSSVLTLRLPSQAESNEYGVRLAEQSELLQKAEELSTERGQQVEELQRLLGSMQIECGVLKDKMAEREAELLQLKADRKDGGGKEER